MRMNIKVRILRIPLINTMASPNNAWQYRCGLEDHEVNSLEKEHEECRTTFHRRVTSTAFEEKLCGSDSGTSSMRDVDRNASEL